MKKTLILVEGRTNAGKDSLVKAVSEQLNIPIIVSDTDRPMRINEKNGREHNFYSENEMTEIIETKELLAYTKIENPKTHTKGYRYCVQKEKVDAMGSDILFYIIDPEEIKYLKEHYENEYDLIIISIMASESVRKQRSIARGDSGFNARIANENEQFNFFESNLNNYDYRIINEGTVEEGTEQLKEIIEKEISIKNFEKIDE